MTKDYLETVYNLTEQEKKYLSNKDFISSVYVNSEKIFINNNLVHKFVLPELTTNLIEIRKDSRFRPVPKHIHSNLNINYVYSGTLDYTINGEKILLQAGDVCIVDKNVIRSKEYLSENDIIFNISLSNDFFSRDFLLGLDETSILTNFLFSVLTTNSQHDGYLIFRKNNQLTIGYLNQLVQEYFSHDSFRRQSIESLISLIFIQFIRNYQNNKDSQIIHISNSPNMELLRIIEYIEKNATSCTLEEIATIYNYHPKYLSQLIKKNWGQTFKEIQTNQRMKNAVELLKFTDEPISDISQKIGIKNMTSFYKKFFETFDLTPNEYRIQFKNNLE